MSVSGVDYHLSTSYDRIRMSGHVLDWSGQPLVFKSYPGQQQIALPDDLAFSTKTLSQVLQSQGGDESSAGGSSDFASLGRILVLTHTVTAKARYGGTDFYYRSVASAGALYPFEVYVAAMDVRGLHEGVYHHHPGAGALFVLRRGEPLQEVSRVIPSAAQTLPGLVFFVTSIFFRSSWKYRDRAYRYHLLDSGHLLENLALALRSANSNFEINLDFDDRAANQLLGVDPEREACLAVVTVYGDDGHEQPSSPRRDLEVAAPHLSVCSRVSPREIQYPSILSMHEASFICKTPKVHDDMVHHLGLSVDSWLPIPRVEPDVEQMCLHEAVMKRRSMRNFVRTELSQSQFSFMLSNLSAIDAGLTRPDPYGTESLAVGFLSGSIQGIDPGFYLLDRRNSSYGLVDPGYFISRMTHICLDQEWLSNCAVHFLFLCHLRRLEESYGPRGYRYAMLQAGRLGQRLYLSATAACLGCCGIGAFYDAEAADLLGLANGSCLLYLVAAGPVRKWNTAIHGGKSS